MLVFTIGVKMNVKRIWRGGKIFPLNNRYLLQFLSEENKSYFNLKMIKLMFIEDIVIKN
jgi:anaerobic ribonucleoside-triphosphate reductase